MGPIKYVDASVAANRTFSVVQGDGEIARLLDDAVAELRKGQLDGLVVITLTNAGHPHGSGHELAAALAGDCAYPWARLTAAIADTQHQLLSEDGLPPLRPFHA